MGQLWCAEDGLDQGAGLGGMESLCQVPANSKGLPGIGWRCAPLDSLHRVEGQGGGQQKSTSMVETSASEKNLSDSDCDILLDQVLKSGIPTAGENKFFDQPVAREGDVNESPVKVKEKKPDEIITTPEEKKIMNKLNKLTVLLHLQLFGQV